MLPSFLKYHLYLVIFLQLNLLFPVAFLVKSEVNLLVSCCIIWIAAFCLLWAETQDFPVLSCFSSGLSDPLSFSLDTFPIPVLFYYFFFHSSQAQTVFFPNTDQRLCLIYFLPIFTQKSHYLVASSVL